MPFWLRLTLTWLLAIALPLQGWAAASMLHCGPVHDRMAHALLAGGPHAHHHDAEAAAAHASGHQYHQHAMAGDANPGAHFDLGKLGHFKCSACSMCCTAAALPATLLEFDEVPLTHAFVQAAAVTAVSFLTSGPERPPRPLLA
jgi:hypothetical protein